MTLHEKDTTLEYVMETLIENSMNGRGETFGILCNAAMEIKRLRFPGAHRYECKENRIGQSNNIERLNKKIKRRIRVATLFPNEESLLRLVSAVMVEISDERETGKVYLSMEME